MNGKKKFIKAFELNCCQRIAMICRCKKDRLRHKYIGDRWPQIGESPDPTLIMWENLGVRKGQRNCFKWITNLLAFILILINFRIVIFFNKFKDQKQMTFKESDEFNWNPICNMAPNATETETILSHN